MANYLTVEGYINRYGERETRTVTNETPGSPGNLGTYDSAKVELAITDAEEVVEGYIGGRYAIPLVTVPRLVEGIVAILARELLFARKPTPEVTNAANNARKQLTDIQKGILSLAGVEENGTVPEQIGGGLSASSGDAECPTFGRLKQAEYMAPFLGGGYFPNWRR